MAWLRERVALVGTSVGVIALTALLIGAIDAASAGKLWWAIPAAGFLLIAFFAPAIAAVGVTRVAVRSWWPETAAGPDARRAAGVLYAAIAAIAVTGFTFNAALVTREMTSAKIAQAAATALTAVVVAGLLVGLAPLAVRLLGAGLERAARRLGRPRWLLSRRVVLTCAGLALLAIGHGFYATVLSPRLGDVDFSWMPPLSIAAAAIIAGHAAAPDRPPRWAAAAIAGLIAAALIAAGAVRLASPRSMLDMWGETDATSEAIAAVFDLEPLHDAYKTEPPAKISGAAHPDVVLITVDTWRADRTPMFGAGATMPRFVELARGAVRFRAAYAPSNNTRRSLPSMMIGAQPSRIRGRVKGWALVLDPRHTLVAERFRAAGYTTAGFFCCKNMFAPDSGTGFARGIDHVEIAKRDGELADLAAAYLEKALSGKPGVDRPPQFAWIHLLGPHSWNSRDSELTAEEARRRYDRRLGQVDAALGEMLAVIKPAREHAVVVLTSDHGEGLGDHKAMHHSRDLYDSQLRVPLVIAAPGVEPGDVERPVSLIHLAPSLLELAGYRHPDDSSLDPGSFAPLVGDPRAPAPAVIVAEQIKDRSSPRDLRAVIAGDHKLITGGKGGDQLYDLKADPREKRNLAAQHPDIATRLRRELERVADRAEVAAW
jgi:arylsulfatase A-like enzyme